MFQSFESSSEGHLSAARLLALRAEMKVKKLDWLIVQHADEHQNEYLPARAERLAWLTGFTGSAGTALVGLEVACLIVDGRYTLQAMDQMDASTFETVKLADHTPHSWLNANMKSGDNFGFDSWTTTSSGADALTKLCETLNVTPVALENSLIDAIWGDQPALPEEQVRLYPLENAGVLAKDKLEIIKADIKNQNADAFLATDPTAICWLFNIRGDDIPQTPLTLCWCLIPVNGMPKLFIKRAKLNIECQAYLTQLADILSPDDLVQNIQSFAKSGQSIMIDRTKTAAILADEIAQSAAQTDGKLVQGSDPIVPRRAVKNETEIAGAFAAHIRDGAAMCEFLAWLDAQDIGSLDEISCAKKLEDCRRSFGENSGFPLLDIAFDTISAAGPHAASPHYRVNEDSNRKLNEGDIYLVDSGAQYLDGTTDITRTTIIGTANDEQRDRFTRVLQGHIAVQSARFPKGTNGMMLDSFARQKLWQAGLDFAHGTGHGVGSYMSVHEGPQNISPRGKIAFEPGMITSNEPGYYKEGHFGIRIENLELCHEAKPVEGGETEMLGFETLTLCPIDRRLIVVAMLTETERHWINNYHARVLLELSPLLKGDTLTWLERATALILR